MVPIRAYNMTIAEIITYLRKQDIVILKAVLLEVVPDGYVMSSPEREKAIARMAMLVASIDRDGRGVPAIITRPDKVT